MRVLQGFLIVAVAFAVAATASSGSGVDALIPEDMQAHAIPDFFPPMLIEAASSTETKLDTDMENLVNAEAEAQIRAQAELDAVAEAEAEIEALTAGESGADAEADTEAEAEGDTKHDAESESEQEAESESEQESESDAEKNSNAEAQYGKSESRIEAEMEESMAPEFGSGAETEYLAQAADAVHSGDVLSSKMAQSLLQKVYTQQADVKAIAGNLPKSLRKPLIKLLNRAKGHDERIRVASSFLSAFAEDAPKPAAKPQVVESEAQSAIEATAEAETSAEASTEAVTDANAPTPENLDKGVSALRQFARTLEAEAYELSKRLAELQKLNKGSVFKAMDRGPVGRSPTPKERQYVDTGVRSWDAERTNNAMRGRPVSKAEADPIFTVTPSPKY